MISNHLGERLLRSPNMVAVSMSVVYKTLAVLLALWFWMNLNLNLNRNHPQSLSLSLCLSLSLYIIHPRHCGLTWPMGISTNFHTPYWQSPCTGGNIYLHFNYRLCNIQDVKNMYHKGGNLECGWWYDLEHEGNMKKSYDGNHNAK